MIQTSLILNLYNYYMSIRQKIVSRVVNLVTLEAAIAQGLLPNLANTSKPTIVTTVHADTHQQHAERIQKITANQHVRFIPYFAPLLHAHHNHQPQSDYGNNHKRISLLIGDSNPAFQAALDPSRIVTLQEICSVFPQKVPLSMRTKDTIAQRQKLQSRLGFKIPDRVIPFQNILLGSPSVKMWDEAFQLILDCMPSPIIVPYLKPNTNKDDLYRLSLDDFVSGLRKVHATVSTAVKSHPPLNILQYDQRRQLDWIIGEVASSAEEMTIDQFFFTNPPKISNCEGRVRVLQSLKDLL